MLHNLEQHGIYVIICSIVVSGLTLIVSVLTLWLCCLGPRNSKVREPHEDGEAQPLIREKSSIQQQPKVLTVGTRSHTPGNNPTDKVYSPGCSPGQSHNQGQVHVSLEQSPSPGQSCRETPIPRERETPAGQSPKESPISSRRESPAGECQGQSLSSQKETSLFVEPEIVPPHTSELGADSDQKRSNSIEIKEKARMEAAMQEKKEMINVAQKMFMSFTPEFGILADLGSRLQKMWFMRGRYLQFVVKGINQLPYLLSSETLISLNSLLIKLQHPYLLPIYGVEMMDGYISVLIEFVQHGSLRDKLHAANPIEDWSVKYSSRGDRVPLPTQEVVTCGRHILEALIALYKVGFPAIGQIHTGNVFKIKDKYVLGGCENMILGYHTSCYQQLAEDNLLDRIDVIMFGNLIYEISTGERLDDIIPAKDFKYDKIKNKIVKDILRFIFDAKWKGSLLKTIEQIKGHSFFRNNMVDVIAKPLTLTTADVQDLLTQLECTKKGSQILIEPDISELNIDQLKSKLSMFSGTFERLERIGGNSKKLWISASHSKFGDGLLCIAAVTSRCSIFVKDSMKGMKSLFSNFSSSNQFIHTISDVQCAKVNDMWVVAFFQPVMKYSLKDIIYQCSNPLQPSCAKYNCTEDTQRLNETEIAHYGYQILVAMLFLKETDPYLILHIHTGNIFIKGNDCVVGGFENTFLNYQSRMCLICSKYERNIDVLIFGHVMYEMVTGKVLDSPLPSEKMYELLQGCLRDITRYIFELNFDKTELLHSLNDIIRQSFFRKYYQHYELKTISWNRDKVKLFEDLHKSKPRNQDGTRGLKRRISNTFRLF